MANDREVNKIGVVQYKHSRLPEVELSVDMLSLGLLGQFALASSRLLGR